MKSNIYNLGTTVLFVLLSLQSISQSLDDIYRGHLKNDFYYVNSNFSHLLYITDDGENVEIKNRNAFWNNQYVTDPTPGKIYSLYNSGITESNDYGKTFTMLSQSWMNAYTGINAIQGGEIAGLYYIGASSSGNGSCYLITTDAFLNVKPVNYYPLEVGFTPDEFYSCAGVDSNFCLTHSINSGISFDTMNIADTIINDYYHFYKLSRGSQPGELFLVTMFPSINWHYRLYHSIDYGATWAEKNTPEGIYDPYFTAGRGDCKFFIVNVSWYGEPDYTLDIYTSSDCGETYSKNTHKLPTYAGTAERTSIITNLKLSPNPAKDFMIINYSLSKPSDLTAIVYNQLGEKHIQIPQFRQNTGDFSLRLNLEGLPAGMYSVQIVAGVESIATGKFIISH